MSKQTTGFALKWSLPGVLWKLWDLWELHFTCKTSLNRSDCSISLRPWKLWAPVCLCDVFLSLVSFLISKCHVSNLKCPPREPLEPRPHSERTLHTSSSSHLWFARLPCPSSSSSPSPSRLCSCSWPAAAGSWRSGCWTRRPWGRWRRTRWTGWGFCLWAWSAAAADSAATAWRGSPAGPAPGTGSCRGTGTRQTSWRESSESRAARWEEHAAVLHICVPVWVKGATLWCFRELIVNNKWVLVFPGNRFMPWNARICLSTYTGFSKKKSPENRSVWIVMQHCLLVNTLPKAFFDFTFKRTQVQLKLRLQPPKPAAVSPSQTQTPSRSLGERRKLSWREQQIILSSATAFVFTGDLVRLDGGFMLVLFCWCWSYEASVPTETARVLFLQFTLSQSLKVECNNIIGL